MRCASWLPSDQAVRSAAREEAESLPGDPVTEESIQAQAELILNQRKHIRLQKRKLLRLVKERHGDNAGFQVLLESGLLSGAMLTNRGLCFICRYVYIRVENASLPFTCASHVGQVLRMPIAHQEGCYYNDSDAISEMEKRGQVVFRYCGPDGRGSEAYNPNGSVGSIAGICNKEGNVLGMMPHPERCAEILLGSEDGRVIFSSMLKETMGVAG